MGKQSGCLSNFLLVAIITCSFLLSWSGGAPDDDGDEKVYVVYMGERPKDAFPASDFHSSILEKVIGSRAPSSLVHSYSKSFNGFAAKLTKEDVQKLAEMDGVVSVFPSERNQLHTTRSWDFMGFPQQVERRTIEGDIIVGVLDTGIWPESPSFSDKGFGPPPRKWKGSCQSSSNFTCNNKIIGAKIYRGENTTFGFEDVPSPRDTIGHGSHTASTAAGNIVSRVSLLGYGAGTARGAVPSARVAVYKVCWSDGCYDADLLAAFDDAIADGVDVISVSIGGFKPRNYFEDPIAIGAFHAMKNGILTSNSASNEGPKPATLKNFSPWSLSVAASTIDRKFLAKVQLGNGEIYEGLSINTFEPNGLMYPLIHGRDAPNVQGGFNQTESRYCFKKGCLDSTLVKGKIVVCDWGNTGDPAVEAGAVGMIMQKTDIIDVAFSFPLPATFLNPDNGTKLLNYLNSTRNAAAMIFKSTESKDEFAPVVVSFSSRGPNPITSDILKPDLTAPGVDILAAWSEGTTMTHAQGDTRRVPYNILSGTSMSCPHATGAAAYVKSFHPTWSPAAIKSALMTTAKPMSPEKNTDAEFAYGSGHIDPVNAVNPGLVYDAGEIDYVKFLCGQNYNTTILRRVTGDQSACSDALNGTTWDLNYPSFTLSSNTSNDSFTRVFHRTLTNVGTPPNSTYKATVYAPPGLSVKVEPTQLTFDSLLEKKIFVLTVEANLNAKAMISGSLVWDDGVHHVRSPIVAYIPSV